MSVSYQSARQVAARFRDHRSLLAHGPGYDFRPKFEQLLPGRPPQTSEFSFILGQQPSGPWSLAPWCCKSTGSA